MCVLPRQEPHKQEAKVDGQVPCVLMVQAAYGCAPKLHQPVPELSRHQHKRTSVETPETLAGSTRLTPELHSSYRWRARFLYMCVFGLTLVGTTRLRLSTHAV